MNVYHATKAHRLMMSDIINLHLERHGFDTRVHPDTLTSRGIDRRPEPKLRPSESAAYRKHGRISDTMQTILGIRQARAASRPQEQQQARDYWEGRKVFLGIIPAMPPERQIAQLLLKRHGTIEAVPLRYQKLLRRTERSPDLARQLQRLTRQLEQSEEHGRRGGVHVRLQEERDRGLSW
jgi:hypothetical protein